LNSVGRRKNKEWLTSIRTLVWPACYVGPTFIKVHDAFEVVSFVVADFMYVCYIEN
jgi:hypothetical protein